MMISTRGFVIGLAMVLAACDTSGIDRVKHRAANPQTLAGLYLKLRAEQQIRTFIQAHSPGLTGLDDGDVEVLNDACQRLTDKRPIDAVRCTAISAGIARRAIIDNALDLSSNGD